VRYDRTVIEYHGCDADVAERILSGEPFRPSRNDYDWLGHGTYFWEYGPARALRFAEAQCARGKIARPAVVGALIQLGNCFDLMDTKFTSELEAAYETLEALHTLQQTALPNNGGDTPEKKLRRLDCAVLNYYLSYLERNDTGTASTAYDTVRCAFLEGPPAFPGSGIQAESHVQLAVRNPSCILGVFRPR
jgi:hypothetical protein